VISVTSVNAYKILESDRPFVMILAGAYNPPPQAGPELPILSRYGPPSLELE